MWNTIAMTLSDRESIILDERSETKFMNALATISL